MSWEFAFIMFQISTIIVLGNIMTLMVVFMFIGLVNFIRNTFS